MKFGKFSVMHLLNATLAGGVMIGGSSHMFYRLIPALLVGMFAGIISTICFNYFPKLF